MSGEFSLIDQYFAHQQACRPDVILAQGDDCAVVQVPAGQQVAISTDTLVAGTHFLHNADPAMIAHKALASNISDLAAMGAQPAWVSMGISLPEVDHDWLKAFCDAFFNLADYYGIQLIGGDTTKGPLVITLTVQGLVPAGEAMTRSGAKVGDLVYVTGHLGDAKAGLDVILETHQHSNKALNNTLLERHFLSSPRVAAGLQLRGLASAAIDISDGLVADLGHILKRSNVGADLYVDQLPVSQELKQFLASEEACYRYALTSGEEYELCFTAPKQHAQQIRSLLADTPFTCIGEITERGEIHLYQQQPTQQSIQQQSTQQQPIQWQLDGFDHFKANS
ncbi:thiamine-phosphate kinase [Vibrio hippocampi]|uniref:Thiamine-monophosphate kinase n=1 Tax=Vibrio hippocampi TaxID=654686 RepID=A0ABN8DGH6_9VIBR|nr:thiamine-phosphate kinase [Vibrio hippocampi]CAH0526687.1 Thiamine-monophosphate kinase [Vibrio hippocampi]